jgi:hypothetical protein
MDVLTAHTQIFTSPSISLPESLVDGLAQENFRDKVGVKRPTQHGRLFLLVGLQ